MIVHIVSWKLKEKADGKSSKENALLIKEKLESLKNVIEEIIFIQVGINTDKAPEGNFDCVLISHFHDFESLNRYQVHPAHQEAAAFIKRVVHERVAVDYEQV